MLLINKKIKLNQEIDISLFRCIYFTFYISVTPSPIYLLHTVHPSLSHWLTSTLLVYAHYNSSNLGWRRWASGSSGGDRRAVATTKIHNCWDRNSTKDKNQGCD
ncbi:uncharacterized protein LOC114286513 [Camellia sinensis]|uniref:uncharacterized protein LOC114286513 n=1 Tax=Camellia sinensis TaxID=4442 RepID=UPI001035DE96|nr:uncharacterized protein LOC114286513 [Camellia sinensis]